MWLTLKLSKNDRKGILFLPSEFVLNSVRFMKISLLKTARNCPCHNTGIHAEFSEWHKNYSNAQKILSRRRFIQTSNVQLDEIDV